MAYISQERKKQLAPNIKAVLKKYGAKGTIGVKHHSSLVVNISSSPFDFIGVRNAEVKKEHGGVIKGLYAVGNCSAAILPTYPGPGATLGPAMTMAYQAAKHINAYQD